MIKIFELNLFRTDFKCDSCGEWFSSVPGYEGKLLNLNLRLTPREYIKSTCEACVAMCCTLEGNHDNSVNKLSPKFGSHHTKETLRYTVSAYGYRCKSVYNMRASEPASHASQYASHSSHASQ